MVHCIHQLNDDHSTNEMKEKTSRVNRLLVRDKVEKVCRYFRTDHSVENHDRQIIERNQLDFLSLLVRTDHSIQFSIQFID